MVVVSFVMFLVSLFFVAVVAPEREREREKTSFIKRSEREKVSLRLICKSAAAAALCSIHWFRIVHNAPSHSMLLLPRERERERERERPRPVVGQ